MNFFRPPSPAARIAQPPSAIHPPHRGEGWLEAGDLAAGNKIRASDLAAMTVLAVDLDPTPQLAYNMEVAGAHTYFAGELEAWGHNSRPGGNIPKAVRDAADCISGGRCEYCGENLTDLPGFPNSKQYDHITALVQGGTSKDITNIACACRTCNLRKGRRNILDFFKLLGG